MIFRPKMKIAFPLRGIGKGWWFAINHPWPLLVQDGNHAIKAWNRAIFAQSIRPGRQPLPSRFSP